jgi:hypothetical protein
METLQQSKLQLAFPYYKSEDNLSVKIFGKSQGGWGIDLPFLNQVKYGLVTGTLGFFIAKNYGHSKLLGSLIGFGSVFAFYSALRKYERDKHFNSPDYVAPIRKPYAVPQF